MFDFHEGFPALVMYDEGTRTFIEGDSGLQRDLPLLCFTADKRAEKARRDFRDSRGYRKCKYINLLDVVLELCAMRPLQPEGYVAFVEKYGFLRINRTIDKSNHIKEDGEYKETLAEVEQEISDMYKIISAVNKYRTEGRPVDSQDDESFEMGNSIQMLNNKMDKMTPVLWNDYDSNSDSFVFRPKLNTHRLIDLLYYSIYHDLVTNQGGFRTCNNCGDFFRISNKKKIIDKCPSCVKKEKRNRNNKAYLQNPYNRLKNKIYHDHNYLVGRKGYDFALLDRWYASFQECIDKQRCEDSNCEHYPGFEKKVLRDFLQVKKDAYKEAE